MNKWKHACCNGVSLAEEVITELKNCVNLQLNNVSHCISFIFHGWKGFWVIKILHHVLLTVFFFFFFFEKRGDKREIFFLKLLKTQPIWMLVGQVEAYSV